MSGSKKRAKAPAGAEHSSRLTQSSVNSKRMTSESVGKEQLLLMCSCGSAELQDESSKEEIVWNKEDSVAEAEKKRVVSGSTVEKAEKPKDTAALVTVPEKVATIEQQEALIAPPNRDSQSEDKTQSPENSFDDGMSIDVGASMQQQQQQERMDSTSFSEENYRTPLLSPDLWPQEEVAADEMIHKDMQNIVSSSPRAGNEEEAERNKVDDDWYGRDETSPDRGEVFLVQEIKGTSATKNDDEYRSPPEAVKQEPQQQQQQDPLMMVAPEPNYDRLTGDMLISLIESHRDALNDQKILLAQQTDAINRLASAVEKQTKIISTLNENNLPILHN